jgi:type IV secretion system protein VirB5
MRVGQFNREGAKQMSTSLRKWLGAVALGLTMAGSAHAGIPVIDTANLVQSIQSVLNSMTQIQNQVHQITQLDTQINAITSARGLANTLNNPLLHDYIPPAAPNILRDIGSVGYGGLQGTGRALRDAQMLYNCQDVQSQAQRIQCQAQLSAPYQQKGFLMDAQASAANRTPQIQSLMDAASATPDAKSNDELNSRIAAENAMIAHNQVQVQATVGQILADQQIAQVRAIEEQRARNVARPENNSWLLR